MFLRNLHKCKTKWDYYRLENYGKGYKEPENKLYNPLNMPNYGKVSLLKDLKIQLNFKLQI